MKQVVTEIPKVNVVLTSNASEFKCYLTKTGLSQWYYLRREPEGLIFRSMDSECGSCGFHKTAEKAITTQLRHGPVYQFDTMKELIEFYNKETELL